MFLTQTTGFLGAVAKVLGWIMNFIFDMLAQIGIFNVGLCIILFTLVIRLILVPFTIKQQQFSKINTIMQPEISKIQKKYRDKKDQASMMKQNEEIQSVYAKYGTNPTGSCLQLIIQMPILFALYRVIYNIPAYITQIRDLYLNIVTQIQAAPQYMDKLLEIGEKAKITHVSGFEAGVEPTALKVVDFLYQFKPETWENLRTSFAGSPAVIDAINQNADKIIKYNNFFAGINVAQTPMNAGFFSVYLLIPISAAFFQFLSAKLMNNAMPTDQPGSGTMAGMNKMMTYYMPIMSFVFCLTLPAGIGIYWAIGAVLQIVQQIAVNKYMDHVDMDAFIEKNKAKAAKKAAKGKKSFMQRMMEAQGGDTSKSTSQSDSKISEIAAISTKKVTGKDGYVSNINDRISNLDSAEVSNSTTKGKGDIASKANLVSSYNSRTNNKGGNK